MQAMHVRTGRASSRAPAEWQIALYDTLGWHGGTDRPYGKRTFRPSFTSHMTSCSSSFHSLHLPGGTRDALPRHESPTSSAIRFPASVQAHPQPSARESRASTSGCCSRLACCAINGCTAARGQSVICQSMPPPLAAVHAHCRGSSFHHRHRRCHIQSRQVTGPRLARRSLIANKRVDVPPTRVEWEGLEWLSGHTSRRNT